MWLFPPLSACLFVSEDELARRVDADGDGAIALAVGGDDCDDADPRVYPGAEDPPYDGVDADCDGADDFDADGDGLADVRHGGDDCDDDDASVGSETVDWHPDCDGDGVGAAATVASCGPPEVEGCAQWFAHRDGQGVDCDDAASDVFPGRTDAPYDGVDADCGGGNDWDADGDGFVDAAFPERADALAPGTGDCDDAAADVFPGAEERWYDGADQACDGGDDFDRDGDGARLGPDCDDGDAAVGPGAADAPYDGVDTDCAGDDDWDADGDGFSVVGPPPLDCDDGRADVAPGQDDPPYDGLDADCDGGDDFDADRDGFALAFDCDDARADVAPGADDPPYDGLDADCDGRNDHDADGDGYVATGRDVFAGGTAPGVGDCADLSPAVNPGATEAWYDGVDGDCDGADDLDRDGDGARVDVDCDDGDPLRSPLAAEVWYDDVDGDCAGGDDHDQDGDGVPAPADCDDTDAAVSPLRPEVWYDGVDGDCDGADDLDADGDGARSAASGGGGDCADFDPARFPGAPDAPYDDVDSDCDGAHDHDVDGDGFVAAGYAAWAQGLGTGDCDDLADDVFPGAAEVWYDGVDADCDGADDFDRDGDGAGVAVDCDDGDVAVSPTAPELWYDGLDADCDGANDFDQDGDGYVSAAFPTADGGTAPEPGDCDDLDAAVNPGAGDLPGVDRDCDGVVVVDLDGDGVAAGDDCDDADPARWVGGVHGVSPGDDVAALVAAACPGAELALPPITFTLAGPVRAAVPLTLRGGARLVAAAGERALDVVAGPFVAIDVRFEGGIGDAGGCARVAGGTRADLVGTTFEGCVATADGGAVWVGPGADVRVLAAGFVGSSADRGGDVFAAGAAVSLQQVTSEGASAREGGAWWVSGGTLAVGDGQVTSAAAASSGGALHAEGVALDLDRVSVLGTSSGDRGAGVTLLGTTGRVDRLLVQAATAPSAFGGRQSVVHVEGGGGLLELERVRLSGTAGTAGLRLHEPRGEVHIHDLEVGYHAGFDGVSAVAESGSGTLSLDNVYVHNLQTPGSGSGIYLYNVLGAHDWALRNATITRTPAEWQLFFGCHLCSSLEIGSVVVGSEVQYGQAAGVMWFDTGNTTDVHHVATAYGRDWLAAYSGPVALPPSCVDCRTTVGHPFVVPLPGTDVHLDPASPLALAGDPAPCGASTACLEPGYFGGPVPPEAW